MENELIFSIHHDDVSDEVSDDVSDDVVDWGRIGSSMKNPVQGKGSAGYFKQHVKKHTRASLWFRWVIEQSADGYLFDFLDVILMMFRNYNYEVSF